MKAGLLAIIASIIVLLSGLLLLFVLKSTAGTQAPTASTTQSAMTQAPASMAQVFLPFLDMAGSDLAGSPVTGVATASSCLNLCSTTPGCVGVSYGPSLQSCWLKSSFGNAGLSFTGSGAAKRILGSSASVIGSTLQQSVSLAAGSALADVNGNWALLMQSDNNLVIYNLSTGTPAWSTGTQGRGSGAAYVTLQPDSNLNLKDSTGTSLWASGKGGGSAGPYLLTMQSSGNLVVSDASGVTVWTSGSGNSYTVATNVPAQSGTYKPVVVPAVISGPNGTVIFGPAQVGQAVQLTASNQYTSVTVATGYSLQLTGPTSSWRQTGPVSQSFNGSGYTSGLVTTGG